MDLHAIANELVAGCRTGRELANIDKLYAANAVSVEAADMGGGREKHGSDAIKAKHAWWENHIKEAQITVSDPLPHGDDRFAVHFVGRVTVRATGEVMPIDVIGIYHVHDGRISREEFYYSMYSPPGLTNPRLTNAPISTSPWRKACGSHRSNC